MAEGLHPSMIVDCISDLHGHYPDLEGGDLLLIAGDLTVHDRDYEHRDFILWLAQIQKSKNKYEKIIYIGGNHDNFLHDPNRYGAIKTTSWNIDYLCDTGTEFQGLKIWGTPWSMTFPGMNPACKAFTVDHEIFLEDKWEQIPHDVDILITHTPPYGILDQVIDESVGFENGYRRHAGSKYLFNLFKYVFRPKLHVFGHIHEAYGQEEFFTGYNNIVVKSVNASHVNEKYEPVNKPVRVIL
jgi:Icc-related predicted phosphoesterase